MRIDPEDTYKDKLHCSGSLISDRHVLTAGHCFFKTNKEIIENYEFNLIFGANNPTDSEDNKKRNTQSHVIKEVQIHPLFDNASAYFDIAIVEIARPFRNFEENIWPFMRKYRL